MTLTGYKNPVCVYGTLRGNKLVGIHKTFPLVNPPKYCRYTTGFYMIECIDENLYSFLRFVKPCWA